MPPRNSLVFSSLLCGLVLAILSVPHCIAQFAPDKAWTLLAAAAQQRSPEKRVIAVRVLSLLPDNHGAIQLAQEALRDPKPEVRVAAATALGKMHALGSVPQLKELLSDRQFSVTLAAANALHELKDPACYEVYYAILTGRRKSSEGFFEQETEMFHDPKELAKMGFEQGIGYLPYAGIGWDALRTIMKDRSDGSPVKAAAASHLASDPDPRTAAALLRAAHDRNWVIRVAALQAIAERGDPSLMAKIEPLLRDSQAEVQYTAAATIVRLGTLPEAVKGPGKD
ncbi:MAG TPA: HEAT repeat domain-containing protein [Candidatus Sulfotelmatobacter sp.]|nr:HEAT repeat domain-containing protein [Candidatus Sulfotelmatobacter sp.]